MIWVYFWVSLYFSRICIHSMQIMLFMSRTLIIKLIKMRRYYSKSSKINAPLTSDIDIENLSKDAKLKTHYYHVSQFTSSPMSKRDNDSNNEQDYPFTSGKSLNRLRQKTKQQMNFQTSLGNKISYFSSALDRQKQVVTLARKKYEKIIQVRSKSIAQKKQLSKEREKLREREFTKASMKASAVRMERRNSYQNMELLRAKKQEIAIKLKNNTANNQKIIAEKQEEELSKKKEIVVGLKKSSEFGRECLHRYYQQKILRGKKDHSQKLVKQQQESDKMRTKNARTYTFFKQKVEEFKKQREQYDRELSQYEKILGKYIGFRKTKSNNSFYVTS